MNTDSNTQNKNDVARGATTIAAMFGSRRYYIFFIGYIAAVSAFGSFVNDMYLPTLPSMTRFFGCSVSVAQLGLTMSMVGVGVGQIVLGPLSDKYGRKPILVWTSVLFAIAALLCVFAPDIHIFNLCRLFQGLGASGGYFLARAIPADICGGRTLAKIMAVIGAINGFAPAFAPVAGGIVADAWGWRGVFVILAIYAVFIIALSPKMRETLPPSRRNKGDLRSMFEPYKLLIKKRPFMTHVLLKGAALGLLYAYISSAPFIYQDHFGYTQTQFGLWMGLNAVFVAVGAMLALRFSLLKKAAVAGAAMLVTVIAVQFAQMWLIPHFWLYQLLNMLMMFALGMVFTTSNTLAMNEGRQYAGEASAVLGVFGYVFGATVSPLVGIGNIFHATAIAMAVMTLLIVVFALLSRRLPADLNQP